MGKIERIILGKSAYKFVIGEVLGLKNLHCKFCKVRITKNNFGWIEKDNYVCNNIVCLIQKVNEQERGF